MKRIIIRALTGLIFIVGQPAFAAIAPIYQVQEDDYTWTHQGGGVYTVPSIAEDYANEVWERPVQDNEWTDDGTTRQSNKMYRGYADLAKGAWGVDDTYLYMKWEVVGAFQHEVGKTQESKLLEGHYYFYAKTAGSNAFAIEVESGKDLGTSFGSGKVKVYDDPNNDVGSLSSGTFDNSNVVGQGRTNTSTFVTEVAVSLSDLGLSKSDFVDNALDWAYLGVAVSNPSSINSDIFANGHYSSAIGSGAEYDTIQMGTVVPIPAAVWLFGSGLLGLFGFSRRKKPARL